MQNQVSAKRNGDFIGGLIVVSMGLWFLLNNFGVNVPSLGAFWPIFPIVGGGAALWGYVNSQGRAPEALIPGVIAILIGSFFFLFTLGIVPWETMGVLWPIFPLIVGIAFVMASLAGGPKELIVPGVIVMLVGGLGFAGVALGWEISMGQLWPVFMILGGLGMLIPYLRRG